MLAKILSSSVRTNTQVGNPRKGKQFIEATDVAGRKVHRYGLDGKSDVEFATPKRTAYGKPVNTVPTGGLVNQIKGSARFGESFKVATRGGLVGHLYANGHFEAMGKAKK